MAAPPINTPQVEEVFKNSTLRAQAEHPDTLERLGPKWSEFLAAKGRAEHYLEDLQLYFKMSQRPPFFTNFQGYQDDLDHCVLCIISPIDLLPDAIPLLGLVDDVLVAGFALRQASAELERYRQTVQTT